MNNWHFILLPSLPNLAPSFSEKEVGVLSQISPGRMNFYWEAAPTHLFIVVPEPGSLRAENALHTPSPAVTSACRISP